MRPPLRSLGLVFSLAVARVLGGCTQRSLPLPPPSITAQAIVACPASECPDGGLIVTLQGLGLPNSLVVLQDTAAHASAPTGETLTVATEADTAGAWRAVVGPVRVRSTASVLAPRVGDEISVFQITPPSSEVSMTLTFMVPAPP